MANTYITTNTRFKPFSFQEMIQPYQMYTEAYDKADAELNTLLEDAAIKGFNFAPQDTAEAAAYNTIIDRLKAASDQLAIGLNPQLSKEINQLNKDYRKVLLPIQQQLDKRAELAAEQRELLAKNPNLRFSKDYSTASLKDITGSSTYDVYNLDTITEDVKKDMTDFIKGVPRTDFKPIPIGKTSNVLVKTGYGYDSNEFDEQLQDTTSPLYKLYESKVANLNPNMPDAIKKEAIKEIYNTMKANAGLFTFDTVIDYSTKPTSSSSNSGGKGSKKPEIYGEIKQGDKFASLTYNGKMMTAELEWFKNDKGEDVYRIKPETIKGIPTAAKDKQLTDEELQIVIQTYKDDEGNVIKTVETQRGKASAFEDQGITTPTDSTTVDNSIASKRLKK